jgi:hypothetical protein
LIGTVGCPLDSSSAQTIPKAISRLTAGPARITTTRFHTGWLKYARARSSGAISSAGFIPVIFT